jgi:hypothetical protein
MPNAAIRQVVKFKTERTYVIRFIRHSEAPQRWKFHLGGSGRGTLSRKGSPSATLFSDAGGVFRLRSEEPANRGKNCIEHSAGGLSGRPGHEASSATADGTRNWRRTTTRTLDSAYPVYLMAALGGGGYRRRIIETE